ncbi:MAG: glycosyl transferase [Anaerolineae bacterium SM23_84]|nr:MAG: glycosyl transferase [Anaerolineae bacterium SM23_84]
MRKEQPFFSIVIPTYARLRRLATCLQSLACLDYPRDRFEVVVVDDGSETSPEAVVASFCDQLDVTLLKQAHAGPAAARNTGAARARGKFLAFTDDDCAPALDWLQRLTARFARAPDCAIGGRTLNALPDNLYSTASQLIVDVVYAHYNVNPDQASFLATNNLAIPADRFQAIGGFDAAFFPFASEDRDFCNRWLHHGYRMIYAPEVLVYHAHALTFRTFLRQHFSYGCGAFRFHKARARRGSGRFMVEVEFYRNLLSLLRNMLSQVSGQRALSLATLLVLWQVANAVGFFWQGMNRIARK